MTTEPDAPHVFAHSVPGDTSLHTGPPEGCTLPACAPAPLGALAGREQRRRTTANILARIDRAKRIHEDEATLLRTLVTAEQADGDQAREQLAAHTGTLTASDVLVQHDVTRKALCDALDAGYHLNWQQLVDTAQRSHDANAEWQAEAEQHRKALAAALGLVPGTGWDAILDCATKTRTAAVERAAGLRAHEAEQAAVRARQGEAEAVRAREAAEAGERRAMGQRQEMAEERFAWQERGDRAERRARSAETELRVLRSGLRARQAEAGRVAADDMIRATLAALGVGPDTDPVIRARETLARAEKAEAEVTRLTALVGQYADRGIANGQRAERAEAERDEARQALKLWIRAAGQERERAERAEATLTAVRALLPDDPRDDKWTDHVTATAVRAALGDPQPATEPAQPAVTWAPRPCGEALWGSHGGHRYMLGGKGYQCPGGDVRQPAEAAEQKQPPDRSCVNCGRSLSYPQGWYLRGAGPWCSDCKPEPGAVHTHLTEPQPILVRVDLVGMDKAIRDAIRRTFRDGGGRR